MYMYLWQTKPCKYFPYIVHNQYNGGNLSKDKYNITVVLATSADRSILSNTHVRMNLTKNMYWNPLNINVS